MTKKYFFFDYDGTLTVPKVGTIPDSTKKTLERLMENGHFVAIATGRLQCDAYERSQKLGIHNLISDGGNGLTINGKLIELNSLDIPRVIKLLDELEQENIGWALTCENLKVRYTKTEQFMNEVEDTYMETRLWPEMDYNRIKQIFKAFVSCYPETEKNIKALEDVPTVRYRENCLFIEPDDKSIGIMKMADYFNAPHEDIVVFGDGTNDIKMFREEWTSIAMGNGREILKAKANFVTRASAEGGIEYACKYFGWI